MGLKRKASFLSSPTSSSSSSPRPTSFSPESQLNWPTDQPEQYNSFHTQTTWQTSSTGITRECQPSWLSSRTRKRFRDNRPDADTIHQHTLQKLFAAQRSSHSEPGDRSSDENMTLDDDYGEPVSLTLDSEVHHPIEPNPHQRSIHSFFSTSGTKKPPRIPSPHLRYPTPRLSCEDCSLPLLSLSSRSALPTAVDGMDVDALVCEDWGCQRCHKQVCDVCAVQGNSRVCLECAMPGGGQSGMQIDQKRRLDGVAWL